MNLLLTYILISSRVTHLEELAFWLYLLHQNPDKEAWFSSWEYRLWYIGTSPPFFASTTTMSC